MEKSGNAMEGFLYRLLPPRAFAAGLPRHRLEPSALVPRRRASRVNYARLSGRAAHIGGFAVIGKGGRLFRQPESATRPKLLGGFGMAGCLKQESSVLRVCIKYLRAIPSLLNLYLCGRRSVINKARRD